jgi:hypothetical protein
MNDHNRRNLESGQRCRQWIVDFVALIPGGSMFETKTGAEFNDKMSQMTALKSTITHMVPNFCSGNPGAIAAWNSAAHVEAPPKKKPTPPTP